jgi:hypothetical protein
MWLHFVGKGYYTLPGFEREAEKFGISRKVALRLLGAFSWGDRVWLAQGDMWKKTRKTEMAPSIVIGEFRVTKLGLSPEALEYLRESFDSSDFTKHSGHRTTINRGCGSYIAGTIWQTPRPLIEIAAALRECSTQVDAFLQGPFTPISYHLALDNFSIGLDDLHFRWGYRRFDGDKFLDDASNRLQARRKALDGGTQFDNPDLIILPTAYIPKPTVGAGPLFGASIKTGLAQEMKNYHQAGLYSTLKSQETPEPA